MLAPGYLLLPPLVSFVVLSIFTGLSAKLVKFLGVLGLALSALASLFIFSQNLSGQVIKQHAWTWIPGHFLGLAEPINIAFSLDTLSLTMSLMITVISTLIAIYSTEYMEQSEGLSRYFGVMNLFVACMLLLVLADNLLLLFVGWEGVGLASYVLIAFYYREEQAQRAAMKAFIITRIGDVFLLLGIIICYLFFNTVNINQILERALGFYEHGEIMITIAALCFFMGAAGKSAQIPLHTWLADAMWGPTPISALIHAATMVTAGVYLVARLSALFYLSTLATTVVLIAGIITMIAAGLIAIVQTDLKRILAYSTMSQLGFMFVALGAKAPIAAVFHLLIHGFFKALLFLSAGVIGHLLHGYDLAKMGGLRHSLPGIFVIFIIASASLLGLPVLSAGFFSKEGIFLALAHHDHGLVLFGAALLATFLTALYTTRMVVLVFLGSNKISVKNHSGWAMMGPLWLLSLACLTLGWLEAPHEIASISLFSSWLSKTWPAEHALASESLFYFMLPSMVMIVGVIVSYVYYARPRNLIAPKLYKLLHSGLAFDWLYTAIFIKPYRVIARSMKDDIVQSFTQRFLSFTAMFSIFLGRAHEGTIGQYLSFLVMAALVMAGIMVIS